MSNAWELLLKAKWLLDHGESIESITPEAIHGQWLAVTKFLAEVNKAATDATKI